MSDKIAQALGIDADKEEKILELKDPGPQDQDFDYVRKNLRTAIDECVKMMSGLVELAKVAESPRLYDSASNFLKVFTDMNQALIATGLNVKKSKVAEKKSAESVPHNQLEHDKSREIAFEGTTEEFLAMLLAQKSKQAEVIENEPTQK